MKIRIIEKGKKNSTEVSYAACCRSGPTNFAPSPAEEKDRDSQIVNNDANSLKTKI